MDDYGRRMVGPLTMSKSSGGYVDARAYGTSGTQAAIEAALAEISSDKRTLYIAADTWNITESMIIPNNVTLDIEQGALLNVTVGKTLTIRGFINAWPYQIFSGEGTVALGPIPSTEVYVNWWGLIGDGNTDNTNAIQKAFTGLYAGGSLYILGDRNTGVGIYNFATTLTRTGYLNLIQKNGVKLQYTGTGNGIEFSNCQYSILENIYIAATVGASQAGAGLYLTGSSRCKIRNPIVSNFYKGIVIDANSSVSSMYGEIESPVVDGGWRSGSAAGVGIAGIYFTGDSTTTGKRPNAWTIKGGSISGQTAAGFGIKIDCGSGLSVDGITLENNAGYAFYFGGDLNYRSDNHTVSKCWFEGNSLGAAYFGPYAINNTFVDNTYRTISDRKVEGDWAKYNIIISKSQPTAFLSTSGTETHYFSNYSRGIFSYNNPLPNLIPNGAFLLDDPEWPGIPLGWSAMGVSGAVLTTVRGQVTSSPATGAVWKILSDTPPDGFENYLRITTPKSGNNPRVFRRIKVKPGRLYHVGCWVRSSVNQKAFLKIGPQSSDNFYVNAYGTYGAAGVNTWEYISTVFLVPEKGTGVGPPGEISDADILQITLYNSGTEGTTADFAGIQVNAGGVAGDYQECESTNRLPLRQIANKYGTTVNPSTNIIVPGETIRTFNLSPGIMGKRGIVDVTYTGYTTGTAGDHIILCKFGTLIVCTLTIAEAVEWAVRARIENYTPTRQRVTVLEVKGASTPVLLGGADLYQVGTVNTANSIAVAVHGTVANSSDYIYCTGITVVPLTPWFDQSDGASYGLT